MRLHNFYAWMGAVLLSFSALTHAEQMKLFGDIEVHYSLVSTQFLPQQVAKSYGLTRAKDRQLLNIAVRQRTPDDDTAETRARSAVVEGIRSDLIKNYELKFQEVREGDAIYYLYEFRFINREIARFDIQIVPTADEGAGADTAAAKQTLQLEFTKQLYFDE